MTFLVYSANPFKRDEKIKVLIKEKKPQSPENDFDTLFITSEGNEIGVEEIRQLKHWLSLKAYHLPPKIAVIGKAETLTNEAQALLAQIIDKDNEKSLLILGAPHQESLSQNIVSRCQVISLPWEMEISLGKEEFAKEEALAQEIMSLTRGKRLKLSEKFKSKEEAILFCQNQLFYWRKQLIENPHRENLNLCCRLKQSLQYLNDNTNARLTIDNLLLFYPLK